MKKVWLSALIASLSCAAPLVHAADKPVRIGYVTTLSTPAGYLGEDSRDAFNLAIKEEGGKLGGVPVELIVEDDGLQPAKAKQITDRLTLDGVKIIAGPLFSNVVAAVAPSVAKENAIFISGNSGPSVFAGEGCMANYFATATQNNTSHEIAGQVANDLGYKKMVLLAANYQGGRDALEGFKKTYKGEITEIYTKLNQLDYSVEIARIRAMAPDAIYQFHTGGSGINFVKQYGSAGLATKIPMVLTVYAMDEKMLGATGDVAKGTQVISMWNAALDVPANKAFVKSFTQTYKRAPTIYAAQSYDTARLLGAALKATGGKVDDIAALRAAIKNVKFDSIRGNFKFANNQHPVQDWWLLQVDSENGQMVEKVVRKAAAAQGDAFASACALK